MNCMKEYLLSVVGVLSILSVGCVPDEEMKVRNLVLRENPGLRHVLQLYEGDSLKYKAALFLIDNLPYHQGVDSGDLRPMYKSYELFSTGKFSYQEALDSAARQYGFSGVGKIAMKKDGNAQALRRERRETRRGHRRQHLGRRAAARTRLRRGQNHPRDRHGL